MKNIAYLGTLVALLDIDMGVIDELLEEKFSKKKALRDSNHKALRAGYDFAMENFECPLPIRLEKMHATDDRILIDGNTATALGCVYAGATVAAWYPITPATSVMDSFKELCAEYRKDPETGKNNYCIVQAEDELAAIGMVIGASWNGARAFTSTAGPGISLMSELIGLAYYAEIPAVIVDVQRTGPSTGMPTRTQQGDILACAYASHGDTKHILLFPSNPAECFSMAVEAFDLAERFQTPVFLLSDLDIGMNDWVCPRLKWDDSYRPNRGRVLGAGGAGEDDQVLPLLARERRPRRRPHAAGRAQQGRLLHARLGPQQAGRLHRGPRRVPGGDGPPGQEAQGGRGGRPGPHRQQAGRRRVRDHLAGRLRSGGARGGRRAGGAGDHRRLPARAGLPVRRRGGVLPRRPRARLRRRAEPRRPAAHAADHGDQRAQGEAAVAAGLRRLPAVGPPRDRRNHRPARTGASGRRC